MQPGALLRAGASYGTLAHSKSHRFNRLEPLAAPTRQSSPGCRNGRCRALRDHINDDRRPRTEIPAPDVKATGWRGENDVLCQILPAASVRVDEVAGGEIDEVGVRLLTVIERLRRRVSP